MHIDPKLDKMKKHDGLEMADDGYCIKGIGSYGYYSVQGTTEIKIDASGGLSKYRFHFTPEYTNGRPLIGFGTIYPFTYRHDNWNVGYHIDLKTGDLYNNREI